MTDRPIDSLSNFIRMADGRHELGAGALAERIAVEWLPELLAEAERRGAERGWDEGHRNGPHARNPYRSAS